MDPPSIRDEHPAFRLKDALRKCMYRYRESHKRFTTALAIQPVWASDPPSLRTQLGLGEDWSDEELGFVDEHLQRITCIFAWIAINNFDRNLRRLLPVGGAARLVLGDVHLPLTQEQCYRFFGRDTGQDFFDGQFSFAAISIDEYNKGIVEQWPEGRFPFLSEPVPIASGAYGDVFEVTIAKGQLRSAPGQSNDDDRKVALKRFRRGRDWLKEVQGLDILKESISRHNRLTLHLAAMIQGIDFFLFLPLAELGDLELLLQEGISIGDDGQEVARYNFHAVFPELTLKDLIHEFATLMGAIDFLHNHVSSRRNVPVYCAHYDLRPKNVLVFPPEPDSPVGVWKISDFGISSFEQGDGRALAQPAWAQYPTVGDIGAGRWQPSGTTSSPVKLLGPHRAPELSVRGYPSHMSATDIWALGCILCEVLAFGTGDSVEGSRRGRLSEFRYERKNDQGVSNLEDDSFYASSYQVLAANSLAVQAAGQSTFQLRPKVVKWLENISNFPHCDRIVSIIWCMLHPNPGQRLRSDEVFNLMREACSNSPRSGTSESHENPSGGTASWFVAVHLENGEMVFDQEPELRSSARPTNPTVPPEELPGARLAQSQRLTTSHPEMQSRTSPQTDTSEAPVTPDALPDISTPSTGYSLAMRLYDPRDNDRNSETTSTTSSGPPRDRRVTPTYPVPVRSRPSGTDAAAVNQARANVRQVEGYPSPQESTHQRVEAEVELTQNNAEVVGVCPMLLRTITPGSPSAQIRNFTSRRVVIPLDGQILVYLCKVAQSRGMFRSRRNESFELRIRKRSDLTDPLTWQALPLNSGVDWSELSVRSNLVGVLGTDKQDAGVSHVALFDLETSSAVELPISLQEMSQLQKVSCNHGDQLAFCKAREAILWRRGTDRKVLPSPDSSSLSHRLINAQFSHDARYFFAWWGSPNGDKLQVWDLKSGTNPIQRAEFAISRSPSRIHNSFIIPCGNLPGCILRDSQAIVSTVLALEPGNQQRQAERQAHLSSWGFPRFRRLCCATDSQLFYLDESSKIKCHKLTISTGISTLIVEPESALDNSSCPIDDATVLALQEHPTEEDKLVLRMANPQGAIYELVMGE